MVTTTHSPITLENLRSRREEIYTLARQFGVSEMRVFGSIAKGYGTADSDIDFLATFSGEVSLLVRIALIQALEDLLNNKVDVLTERTLHPLMRDEILRTAVPL